MRTAGVAQRVRVTDDGPQLTARDQIEQLGHGSGEQAGRIAHRVHEPEADHALRAHREGAEVDGWCRLA